MAERPFIYRFLKDLRLDDHAGLAAAAAQGEVLPVLIVDAALQTRLSASSRRAAFFCGAVTALAGELRERGSRLIVRSGEPERILTDLARRSDARGVAWSAAYDSRGIERDRQLQAKLEERGFAALLVHDAPVIPPEESAAARGAGGPSYRAFAPYFERWRALEPTTYEQPLLLRFAAPLEPSDTLPVPRDFGSEAGDPAAGSGAAATRLRVFLHERVSRYAIAANIPAQDGTSMLGAHLSFGTISARSVARAVRRLMNDPFALAEQRHSDKAFLRALARRDFFFQLSWFHPDIEDRALQDKMRGFASAATHPSGLDAWRNGTTGFPLVDAGMRQLAQTGWMHPHVRAVAASVLCFDLGVDWRVGRDQWDRWLIEDEPALAIGNWQWIAGVGADMARFPRIYNPQRQRRRFDPAGVYVQRWIPELRDIPPERWHGRETESPQLALALFDARSYPPPIVDHDAAARGFLGRYRAFVSP